MWDFLHNSYLRFERSEYKVALLLFFAAFFIGGRAVFELTRSNLFSMASGAELFYITIMAFVWIFLWYSSGFFMALAWFRHVARAPLEKALYLLLAAVGLWVPILHVNIASAHIHFSFLSYSDPALLKSVLTLMYLSPSNHYMFSEFLVMAIGILILAYLFSRSATRAVLTALGIYGSLIFIQLFTYVCGISTCVVVVPSDLLYPAFLCLYFSVLLCLWLCALFFQELRGHLQSFFSVLAKKYVPAAALFLSLCCILDFAISTKAYDVLFLLLSQSSLFLLGIFLLIHQRDKHGSGLRVFFGIYGLLLLTAYACMLIFNSSVVVALLS